jgi:uncharacterized protein
MFKSSFIFSIFLILQSCGMFRFSDKKLNRSISKLENTQVVVSFTENKNHRLRIIQTFSDSSKPTLLFVHGAPGDSKTFLKYHSIKSLTNKYNLISYDRLGYGFKDGYKGFISIEEQAFALNKIINSNNLKNCTLVAHSFGGAIALKAAVNDSMNISKIMLIACAVDPENEKFFWFGKFGKWKATRWMLPKELKTAGMEKYTHVQELQKLAPDLYKVNQSIRIIHGTKDVIVPFGNVSFLEKSLVNAKLTSRSIAGENHFIPFAQKELVINEILSF